MMSITRSDGQEVRGSDSLWERFLTRYGVPLGALALVIYFFIWPAWDDGVRAMPAVKSLLEQHIEHVEEDARQRFEQGVRLENYQRIDCENGAYLIREPHVKQAQIERCRSVR